MGSYLEINDTLQITTEQGFPADELIWERHRGKPCKTSDFEDRVFEFRDKPGARYYHTPPTRNFLVQNRDGKWIYWGKVLVVEQKINGEDEESLTTSGKYRIIEIWDPDFMIEMTRRNSPEECSYF
jgi:hypothetical protein